MSGIDDAKEILAKCLFVNPDTIDDDDHINDIKIIDSLTFETLVLEIEEKTGRDLKPTDILNLQTVADLAKLLSSDPT
ncbi:MAG: acyl carrier protein [Anderseniella sp.]